MVDFYTEWFTSNTIEFFGPHSIKISTEFHKHNKQHDDVTINSRTKKGVYDDIKIQISII